MRNASQTTNALLVGLVAVLLLFGVLVATAPVWVAVVLGGCAVIEAVALVLSWRSDLARAD